MSEQFTWIDIPDLDQCHRAFVLLRTLPSNRKIPARAMQWWTEFGQKILRAPHSGTYRVFHGRVSENKGI